MSAPVFVQGDYLPFEFFVEDAHGRVDLTQFEDGSLKTDIGVEAVGWLAPTHGHAVAVRMTPLPKPDGTLSRPHQGRVALRMEALGEDAPRVYGTEPLDITVLPHTRPVQTGTTANWVFRSFQPGYPVAWLEETVSNQIVPCCYFGPSPTDPISGYVWDGGVEAVKNSNPPYPWLVIYPLTNHDKRLNITVTDKCAVTVGNAISWDSNKINDPTWPRWYDQLTQSIFVFVSLTYTLIVADGSPQVWSPVSSFPVTISIDPFTETVSVGSLTVPCDAKGVLARARNIITWNGDITGINEPGHAPGETIPRVSWAWV